MEKRQPDLFSYVVGTDSGISPNPFGGICTLACSKPQIRKSANVGDWVIGTTTSPNSDKLVFAMRVDRALTFDMYWNLPEYDVKKPHENNGCGDNVYHEGLKGEIIQVPDQFHNAKDLKRDTTVNRVLISKTFYYFGKESPQIPKKLTSLIQTVQGHKRMKPTTAGYGSVTNLVIWLQDNFKQGLHGDPAQVKDKCKLPADAISNLI